MTRSQTISIIAAVVITVLFLDQSLKFWVKTNMEYLEYIPILKGYDRAFLHFIENEGMAFGMAFGGSIGKIVLSVLRIVFVGVLYYILRFLVNDKAPLAFSICVGLILAGALGNIIDSTFYGLLFSASTPHSVAEFLPVEGGYGSFLQGRVVDMFYFPIIQTVWPTWVPLVGGKPFEFFSPIFNVADTAISVGVISILLFMRDTFNYYAQSDRSENTYSDPEEEVLPIDNTP